MKSRKRSSQSKPSMPNPQARFLGVREAAGYLSCAVWCVRQLIWRKEVAAVRLGKRYVIDRVDLDAYIARLKEAA